MNRRGGKCGNKDCPHHNHTHEYNCSQTGFINNCTGFQLSLIDDGYKQCNLAVPSDIVGSVLLRLIVLLGYQLLVKHINKGGQPSYCQWKLIKQPNKRF